MVEKDTKASRIPPQPLPTRIVLDMRQEVAEAVMSALSLMQVQIGTLGNLTYEAYDALHEVGIRVKAGKFTTLKVKSEDQFKVTELIV